MWNECVLIGVSLSCVCFPFQLITELTGLTDAYSTAVADRDILDATFGGTNVFAQKSHPLIAGSQCRQRPAGADPLHI